MVKVKRMTRMGLVGALILVAANTAADAPLPPPAQTTKCSANTRFCAVSDPASNRLTVYRNAAGKRTDLWSLSGWSRSFAVSDDGDDLVTCYGGLNLLPLDYRPDWTMLTFYRRGQRTRSWKLAELVPDLSRLQRT